MIKVVVADDEEKVAQLICTLVDWESFGMQVVGVAHNGIEALALIRQTAPDIVVTDIRMPGCDGLGLIRQAKEIAPALEFIIISGYRHFEYAQSAIRFGVSDYLLKPIKKDELSATLTKMRWKHLHRTQQLSQREQIKLRLQDDTERRRASLFTVLVDAKPRQITLEEINREYQYQMQPGCFQAVFLKVDGDYNAVYSDGLQVLLQKIQAVINERLAPLCHDMQLLFVGTTGQMLLNFPCAEQAAVREKLSRVLDDLRVQKSVFPWAVFTVALGDVRKTPGGLWESVQTAGYTLAQRLEKGSGLLEYEGAMLHSTGCTALLSPAARALEAGLEIMDVESVKNALQQFSAQVRAAADLSGEDLLYLADNLCSTYLVLCRKLGIQLDSAGLFFSEFRDRMDLCSTKEQLLDCLMATIVESFRRVVADRNEADAKPILKAKRFIAENFAAQITLEQVAGEAGFNASYFSTLFKKETGHTFSEYLQEVRINKAKELLRETDWPIARICEEVGYSDVKYFSGAFKKSTGVKPGEFRKLYS